MMRHPKKLLHELYFEMLRIHEVQLRIESLYHLDEMKTPIHLCVGQEAIAVGVCANLQHSDYISSSHRSHGHYLAKGGNLRGLIAELYCRETGCSKGRGGSMHLVDTSVGHIGSSSIVSGGIPIGTGLGFALTMQGLHNVSVVFFGDGAADEGVLYESINFAILKRLPVVYIFENNEFSVCSHISARQAGELIFHELPQKRMMSATVDGNDILAVYDASKKAIARARSGKGPSLIECKTYRVRGHAGAGSDAKLGYRPASDIEEWERRCPVAMFYRELIRQGILSEQDHLEMKEAIGREIDEAFRFAQGSPLPKGEDLEKYLFCE